MLVLTRKKGEQIRLGDDVVITVIRIKGQSVRIGIEAPRETRVVRAELDLQSQPDEEAVRPPRSIAQATHPAGAFQPAETRAQGSPADSPTQKLLKHGSPSDSPSAARPLENRLRRTRQNRVATSLRGMNL